MANVQQTAGSKLVVKVEDVALSGAFTTICTINAARGITFNKGMNDEEAIDCDNPDAIAWRASTAQTKSVDVSGGGKLHKPDLKRMWDWLNLDGAKNCKIILDDADATKVITFTGAFHLSQFSVTGERGGKVDSELSLISEGAVTAAFGSAVGGS